MSTKGIEPLYYPVRLPVQCYPASTFQFATLLSFHLHIDIILAEDAGLELASRLHGPSLAVRCGYQFHQSSKLIKLFMLSTNITFTVVSSGMGRSTKIMVGSQRNFFDSFPSMCMTYE